GQGPLSIYSPTPESDSLTEISLQLTRVHEGSRGLNGVQDVESRGNEIFNQVEDRPAGVEESFPRRMLVYPVVRLLVKGKKQFPVSFRRQKGPVLGAEIGTGQIGHGGAIPHGLVNSLQVSEVNLGLTVENLVDVIPSGAQADVPLLRAANSLWLLEHLARDLGDVT